MKLRMDHNNYNVMYDEEIQNIREDVLRIRFNETELDQVIQYDNSIKSNDEKIIKGDIANSVSHYISPMRLKDAVESGDVEITEFEIDSERQDFQNQFHSLQLIMENCLLKKLYIKLPLLADAARCVDSDPCKTVVNFVNNYKGTLDYIKLYFDESDVLALNELAKTAEDWAENMDVTLTVGNGGRYGKPYKDPQGYNDIQERLQFITNCRLYAERFKKTIEKDERDQLCAEIAKDDPEFTINFDKYKALGLIKTKDAVDVYNTLSGYYMDTSTVLNRISQCCYEKIGKLFPDLAKECIIKNSGGITAIIEIDNALENNNIMTDQQGEVINQAEAMHDVDLTTSGTIDDDCSDNSFHC